MRIQQLHNLEDGQGLVEYGLIIFLVAILVIAILVLIGGSIGGGLYSNITTILRS
ncbi:MAG: pilus assembly protein [Dehalococcoidia bacterium]|nr:pilus assembly protein [Dehalococcoidia bacterium]